MKIKILFCLLVFLFPVTVKAQPGYLLKENYNWPFLYGIGVSFNAGSSSVPYTIPCAMGTTSEGMAPSAVSDTNGQLLFYTNSANIWDRDGIVMPNGIIGVNSTYTMDDQTSYSDQATQGTLILPVLNNPDQYYVFALNGVANVLYPIYPRTRKLLYSIVDMTLNDGRGDVLPEAKNIVIDTSLGSMMAAVPGNNCNIWLIVHRRLSKEYLAYEITQAGINTSPVSSVTGNYSGDFAYTWGELAISPDCQHIAITNPVDSFNTFTALKALGGVELCDFDVNTGVISDARIVTDTAMVNAIGFPYSACFSPDSKKLYFNLSDNVYQIKIDLATTAEIMGSHTLIGAALEGGNAFPDNLFSTWQTLRLGPDGKIYTSQRYYVGPTSPDSNFVARINYPNLPGTTCGFEEKAIYLPPTFIDPASAYLMCNAGFVKPLMDTTYAHIDISLCSNIDSVSLTPPQGSSYFEWNDGSTDSFFIAKLPGTYWVKSNNYCHYRIDTFFVHAVNIDIDLGQDTTYCNSSFLLRANLPAASYLWNDGSTDSTLIANSNGIYWVEVSKYGCVNRDSIDLKLIDVQQDLGDDMFFCKGDPIQLSLQSKLLPGATAMWNTGEISPAIFIKDTGIYYVTVSYPPCMATDSIRIAIDPYCECILQIPTAFSPNNDGLNDEFRPVIDNSCPVDHYILNIYNRFGQVIFTSYRIDKGWDGTYNGAWGDIGTYMFDLKFTGGTRRKSYYKRGDFLLVR